MSNFGGNEKPVLDYGTKTLTARIFPPGTTLKQGVEFYRTTGAKPCVLCCVPTRGFGVYEPSPEVGKRIGAPKDKIRTVSYPLCELCAGEPGSLDKVEGKVLRAMQVQ